MKYLTAEQVLFLHDRLIEKTGGEHGVRDLGLLESALARPKTGFGQTEFFPDLMRKAAVLIDSLVRNHPFIDGNKRAGIAVAALFLRLNGYQLTASNEELETFTLNVTTQKPELEEMAEWFSRRSIRIGSHTD